MPQAYKAWAWGTRRAKRTQQGFSRRERSHHLESRQRDLASILIAYAPHFRSYPYGQPSFKAPLSPPSSLVRISAMLHKEPPDLGKSPFSPEKGNGSTSKDNFAKLNPIS